MFNWVEATKYQNIKMLSRNGKLCGRVSGVYEDLMCQIVDLIGISDEYIKILRNKMKIELYYGQQIRSGVLSKQTFIDILEYENKELQKNAIKQDVNDLVNHVQDHSPYRLDLKDITVFDFYSRTKHITNKLKQA